ncbi:MAG: hypothetical protein U1F24_03820 [Alphaproteobacteria bacterium]
MRTIAFCGAWIGSPSPRAMSTPKCGRRGLAVEDALVAIDAGDRTDDRPVEAGGEPDLRRVVAAGLGDQLVVAGDAVDGVVGGVTLSPGRCRCAGSCIRAAMASASVCASRPGSSILYCAPAWSRPKPKT